jgi:hypothetical protein
MTKPELQAQILSNSMLLFRLASAVDKLPDSATRGELIYKHNKIATVLANLQANLGKDDCYFGYTDKCPGCCCADCRYLLGG